MSEKQSLDNGAAPPAFDTKSAPPPPPPTASLSVLNPNGVGGSSSSARPSSSSLAASLSKIANTSIIIQVKGRVASNQSRISQLAFSPGGARLVALSRHQATVAVTNSRRWQHLHIFDTVNYSPVKLYSTFGIFQPDYRVLAGDGDGPQAIAFGPESVDVSAAAAAAAKKSSSSGGLFGKKDKSVEPPPPVPIVPLLFLYGRTHVYSYSSSSQHGGQFDVDTDMAHLDVGGVKKGSHTNNVPITAPIAMSPDGTQMIGRSAEDPSEMYLVKIPQMLSTSTPATLRVPACIPGHLAPVTHLAYMPDGKSIVSLAADGTQRINHIDGASPGQCLYRVRVEPTKAGSYAYPARLMAVSPAGDMIVSVWGRQVVRWYPETDVLLAYDLDEVRLVETWPLAFNADANLMVCRTEHGMDIVRVEDGTSAGHLNWTQNGGNYATAAAMTTDGKQLALGLLNGRIMLHELHYMEESAIDKDVPEEEPPAYSKYDD